MVATIVVATAIGLADVGDRDVTVRHGQAVADAVALAGVVGGAGAANEVARRNESTVSSMTWSHDGNRSTLTVEVIVEGERIFRSDAAGG